MKVDLAKEIVGFDGKPLVDKTEGVQAALPDGTQIYLKFGVKVKGPDGEEVELIDNRKPRTIGSLLLELVVTPLKKDQEKNDSAQRMMLFNLAQTFHKNEGKQITLKAEEVVELKERALILFVDPQIYAGIVNAIDPGTKK